MTDVSLQVLLMKRKQCHSATHESNRECPGEHLGGGKMGKVAPVTPPSVSTKQLHEQAHATTMKGFPLVVNQGMCKPSPLFISHNSDTFV